MKADIQKTLVEFEMTGESPEFGEFEKGLKGRREIDSETAKTLKGRGVVTFPKIKKEVKND